MPTSHVADIDEVETARRRDRHSPFPETNAETPHHGLWVILWAEETSGIRDDDVLARRGFPGQQLGGTLGVDVVDAHAVEVERTFFVQHFAGT